MEFLRKRQETVEHAWMSDKYTAVERGRALDILGGAVVLVRHPYDRHPNSGAGNCWCGRDQRDSIHNVILGA